MAALTAGDGFLVGFRHNDPQVWDTLSPREQARVIRLLVEQVNYDGEKGTVSVTFHPSGIKVLADEFAEATP